jgi:hypothetical protein
MHRRSFGFENYEVQLCWSRFQQSLCLSQLQARQNGFSAWELRRDAPAPRRATIGASGEIDLPQLWSN